MFHVAEQIVEIVFEHKIDRRLILNFDETPLGFTSPSKLTIAEKNSKSVPVSSIDNKRQITGTFSHT